MQSKNPVLNSVAQAFSEAAGMADGIRREAETVAQSQLDRLLADRDLVTREEFEVVREMAIKALERVEALEARLDANGQDG